MKEATGELNMTVITVVAIAALVAFFYLVIWPTLKTGMSLTSACSSYGASGGTVTFDDGSFIKCDAPSGNSKGKCTFDDGNGKTQEKFCD